MEHFGFSIDGTNVYLIREGDQMARRIISIDTLSKSYVIGLDHVGQAIREGKPLLEVTSHQAEERKGVPVVGLCGKVHGHPTQPDGKNITTAGITKFHLEGGLEYVTDLGRKANVKSSPKPQMP